MVRIIMAVVTQVVMIQAPQLTCDDPRPVITMVIHCIALVGPVITVVTTHVLSPGLVITL